MSSEEDTAIPIRYSPSFICRGSSANSQFLDFFMHAMQEIIPRSTPKRKDRDADGVDSCVLVVWKVKVDTGDANVFQHVKRETLLRITGGPNA